MLYKIVTVYCGLMMATVMRDRLKCGQERAHFSLFLVSFLETDLLL